MICNIKTSPCGPWCCDERHITFFFSSHHYCLVCRIPLCIFNVELYFSLCIIQNLLIRCLFSWNWRQCSWWCQCYYRWILHFSKCFLFFICSIPLNGKKNLCEFYFFARHKTGQWNICYHFTKTVSILRCIVACLAFHSWWTSVVGVHRSKAWLTSKDMRIASKCEKIAQIRTFNFFFHSFGSLFVFGICPYLSLLG